ncbi:MAG: hypothetical protein MZV65_30550 [Chromatiales bacterium]|nr:hypothetical protein [Chromatiales bacterium]
MPLRQDLHRSGEKPRQAAVKPAQEQQPEPQIHEEILWLDWRLAAGLGNGGGLAG